MTGLPRIAPLGDAAATIAFGTAISAEAAEAVANLEATLAARPPRGVLEIVPGYNTLTVHFDPLVTSFRPFADEVAMSSTRPVARNGGTPSPLIEIPVRYDGSDLAWVTEASGLSEIEVVARHCAVEYRVALLGFVPGFAYLGPIDPTLVLPRRGSPRARVPAGSVAIGGAQTGIYPAETPGGWHLIGRTAVVMFDPHRSPPALLAVGDRVRFIPEG